MKNKIEKLEAKVRQKEIELAKKQVKALGATITQSDEEIGAVIDEFENMPGDRVAWEDLPEYERLQEELNKLQGYVRDKEDPDCIISIEEYNKRYLN